jgi:hypothetical protein
MSLEFWLDPRPADILDVGPYPQADAEKRKGTSGCSATFRNAETSLLLTAFLLAEICVDGKLAVEKELLHENAAMFTYFDPLGQIVGIPDKCQPRPVQVAAWGSTMPKQERRPE